MTSIERILCPIDFSEISQHALAYATAMARWYDARLTVLHVYSNVAAMDLPPLVLDDVDRERVLGAMRRFASCVPSTVAVDFLLQEGGFSHEEIVAQATATRADLLVLGTHGRSGFQHLFLGSVTEKVMRKATCPTLIVPPRAPESVASGSAQFRRILCPVDFSESSVAALEYALRIAEEADAQLTLLHVVEIPTVFSEEPAAIDVDLSRVSEVTAERARRKLQNLIPEQVRTFCTIDTAVIEGRAYREILRQAAEKQSDLIVMGVQGRGALDLLVFGSTTHHVIRASACPVLIVRERA
jgi:nucleotide-binding universal stress UspA family protein